MDNIYFNLEVKNEIAFFVFNKQSQILTESNLENMWNIFETVENNKDIKFFIFKGITDSTLLLNFNLSVSDMLHFLTKWEKMLCYLERSSKISIIIIHNEIAGPGLQLAFACDFRMVYKNANFYFNELNRGMLPGMEIYRLSKMLGTSAAKKFLLMQKKIDSKQAIEIGLVDFYTDDISDTEIFNITRGVNGENSVSIEMTKRLILEASHDNYEEALGNYLAAQSRCLSKLLK
ncbi:MAG: enoyl-CoA hydratase/isomerase family protein [Gammaproteobacteria bacterium]|nr:enoyl-CoA hydratase/isomerase family protein [Gammaproteobacteria bacterium]MCW5583913.1 enoyl-CoA hydratase/isomerase family protein [Gammaproteobacteria bacterium]